MTKAQQAARIVAQPVMIANDLDMSPDDIKALREKHGLTARALGEILQIETDPSRFIRYLETGERPVRGPVRILLEMLQRDELPKRYLKVEPVKRRGRPPGSVAKPKAAGSALKQYVVISSTGALLGIGRYDSESSAVADFSAAHRAFEVSDDQRKALEAWHVAGADPKTFPLTKSR